MKTPNYGQLAVQAGQVHTFDVYSGRTTPDFITLDMKLHGERNMTVLCIFFHPVAEQIVLKVTVSEGTVSPVTNKYGIPCLWISCG